jgi:hypothetical protein
MKILILIIYSDDNIYKEMMKIQRKYIHNLSNVDSYFIQMKENMPNDLEIENDIIYVKGKECYMNILVKTIVALEYLYKMQEYDFVIRTNISTIINIPKLITYLDTIKPKENIYTGGGFYWNLQWLDEKSGIIDKLLWGTEFIGGTSITLSNDVVKCLLNNKNKLRFDIVDDVAIGLFIKSYCPIALENGKKYLSPILYPNIDNKNEIIQNGNKYIFFRNRSLNREHDITIMDLIYKTLLC